MLKIDAFDVRQDYKIWILFSDGTEGEVCLKDMVGKGVFKYWEDYENFKRVSTDPITGTLSWNGDIPIDLDPYQLKQDLH